ncbi:MAG TPA: hypothetical protein DEA63_03845 [Firmicutes bacterium]|nr:hypothetical protein [Bacillota bacterium]
MATFILLSAMPGSGKSSWAKKYQNEHSNVEIVASDDIREKLNGDAGDQSNPKLIWEEFKRQILAHEKGEDITVIGDSTNLSNYFRIYYANLAEAHYDKLVLVWFDVPYPVSLERNLSRKGRVVPIEAMERLKKEYEPLSEEACSRYEEIYSVDERGITTRIK